MHKVDLLPNGLKIVSEPMLHMESVAIGIWIRSGGRYENTGNSGISHILEHLLFKGTKSRDMTAIKHEIEGRGGSFNGFTSEDHTCYLVKLTAKDLELGIDILSDMVTNPRLDENELKKEKSVIIEEINMYMDMPAHHVHEVLAEMMWPDQPLGMPLAGTVETVKAMTIKDVESYKNTYYNSGNMVIVCAGKAEEAPIVGLAKKYLAGLKKTDSPAFERVRLDQKSPSLKLATKKTEQTHMAIGLHTVDRFHADKYALSLLNIILGGNMSSRLFHIVRDEMALCYEISSSIRRYEDCGALVISAGVDHKKLEKALSVILRELNRIRKSPVAEEELTRAKEYYKGQLLFALEDTMSHMLWLGEKVTCGEKDFSVRSIIERVDAVTPDDLMRVAKGVVRDDNLNLAIISPLKDDKSLREKFSIS